MKKTTSVWRRTLSLLCCAAMLLPGIPAATAAGDAIFTEDFESYAAGEHKKSEYWASNGNNTTEFPTVVSDVAYSGSKSLMLKDTKTDSKDGAVQLTMASGPVTSGSPEGTELIATARYKTDGNGSYLFRLTADNVNKDVKTDSAKEWKTISVLNTTTKDNGPIRVWLVSSAANTGTIWWDDVTISVLDRDLGVAYLEEKLTAKAAAADVCAILYTKGMGLSEVDKALESKYYDRLKQLRDQKGTALTWDEIQGGISDVNLDAVAADISGETLAVGSVGPIAVPQLTLPAGVTAKWASVTPAGKNIVISGGNASANAIPTGADESYTMVLRLATATGKAVDVPYTVLLKNPDSYDRELVDRAALQLGVIGAGRTGTVSLPRLEGVTVAWTAIKSGNTGRLALSGTTLTVKSLPEGMNYDEVTVTATLTRGNVSQQVDCTVVIYNPTYRILMDLPNASFEQAGDGLAAGWNNTNTMSAAAWVELATDVARTGSNSIRMVDTNTGNSMGFGSRRDGTPAKVGTEYEVTGWAMGTATAETADRAGAAGYLEFSNGTARKSVVGGAVVPITKSGWSKFSVRGAATDTYVTAMGYSYQATICDMYFDDMLLWEITQAGMLYDIDQLLASRSTDAGALYTLLSSKMLAVSGLSTANKAAYLTRLTADRAARGGALSLADIQASVTAANADVTSGDKQAVAAAANRIGRTMSLSQLGIVPLPTLTDTSVTLAWTAVEGDGRRHVRVADGVAEVISLPASGEKDLYVELTLTVTKGKASTTVPVTATVKAMTAAAQDLITAAEAFDLTSCLNGQSAYAVRTALALPERIGSDITVKWQVLDSATGQPSNAVSATGAVTRPGMGKGDAALILRGTLSKGGERYDHDWYIIVSALDADEARTVLSENTDFESPAPKDRFTNLTGWNKRLKWADGQNEVLTSYATVDTDKVFTGKQSLRLVASGTMASIQNEAVFTVQEGLTYTLEAMVTATGDTDPCLTLRFWNMEGVYIATHTVRYKNVAGQPGSWKNLRVSAVAPAGAVQVTAELDGGTKAGNSWFDAVRLREHPIVPNGSFQLGKDGWTTDGSVTGGKLTLSAGQTALSAARPADWGVAYWLTLTADGGKAALRFVDKDGKTLAEYGKALTSGTNAFAAHAPVGTKAVQVLLTGAMTADEVQILRAPYGNSVGDGDFESAMGTAWELDNATIAPNTGKSGAGLTVKNGGTATSSVIPTVDGKTYTFTVDVKGKGSMNIDLYNIGMFAAKQKTWTVSSQGGDWQTLTCTVLIPQLGADRNSYEHAYIRVRLTGEATFDNAKAYSVTKSVSNASFENINDAVSGSFPYHWAPYGKVAARVANLPGQYTEDLSGLAVQTFGQGGVRSSMLRDIRGGQSYEATIKAKGSGAKLSIEFWGKDFAKLGSQSVTISSDSWKEYSVTAAAPKGTAYASLSVGGEGNGLVYLDQAAIRPTVRTIGTNVQLFLDDWLINTTANVKRTFHPGEKLDPMISRRWYGSQFWNEDKQIYESFNTGSPNYAMYYNTSKDGVNWDSGIKCTVTGFEGDGSMGGPSVFYDRDEKTYKALFYDKGSEWYALATSTDAINWTVVDHVLFGWDVIMVAYDEVNDEYVCTYKLTQANGPDGVKQEKRVHSTATSKDLIHWTTGTRVFNIGSQGDVGDDFVRIDSYGTNIDALGDSYVGFNERFSLDDADGYGGLMDSNLLFSRDLTEDWKRIYGEDGKAITAIPRGPEGSWDDAQCYPRFPMQVGDETWWYYHGWTGEHGVVGVPKVPCVGAIKWRLNGYMSLDFAAGGTLTTEQFILSGDKLHLNAKGDLKVELLDAAGALVATGTFSGDHVDGTVTWDKSVSGQLGKAVSLRITSSNAQLYTLQVKGSVFGDVAPDAWYHQAAHYAVSNGIMSGYGGGKFGPNDTLSRAMVVQMLYNKEGQLPVSGSHGFTDVPATQWYNNAVTWGTANKVMSGYGGGKFGPDDAVTIEQIAVILWNYSGNPEFRYNADDLGEHSSWASNALGWALDRGLLGNVPYGKVTDKATRAQAAQILTNFLR